MDNESPDEHSLSRRGLVKGAAGAAAAGAVTLAVSRTPAAAAEAGPNSAAAPHAVGPDSDGELVVHVRDARTGEMDVYAGTRHIAMRDPALAARLAAAAAK